MEDQTPNAARGVANRRRWIVWCGAAALMLLPVLALRGTGEAASEQHGDFVFLGVLLAGVGGAYELAARTPEQSAYRVAVALALASAVLVTWMTLAVGIIGSEDHPANLTYRAVLAMPVIGAALVRFRPRGMAMVMIAAALAQVLIFVIALVAWRAFTGPITIFLAALWLTSAWLFRKAARRTDLEERCSRL